MGISGKCGFEETVEMNGADEILEKYQVFIPRHELVPLNMRSKKDLVAYYTYGTSMIAYGNDGGKIVLSSESYIDTEERERLGWYYETLMKYYRKCKKNKTKFDKDEALKQIVMFPPAQDYQIELVNRVARQFEDPTMKASIKGIHDPMHDHMRQQWYDLMIEHGWEEDEAYRWVYGWKRWLDKIKAEKYGEHTVQQLLDIEE